MLKLTAVHVHKAKANDKTPLNHWAVIVTLYAKAGVMKLKLIRAPVMPPFTTCIYTSHDSNTSQMPQKGSLSQLACQVVCRYLQMQPSCKVWPLLAEGKVWKGLSVSNASWVVCVESSVDGFMLERVAHDQRSK